MQLRPVIIAALQAAGLAIAGFLVPVLGQMAMLFTPAPLIVLTVLHGRKSGIIATALAAVIVSGLGSLQLSVALLFLGLGMMALALAEGMIRNLRHEATVILGAFVPILLLLVLITPAFLKAGKPPVEIAEAYLHQSMQETRQLYTGMGLTDLAQTLDLVNDKIIYYAARLFPGIIAVTALLQSLVCYGVARSIILRRRPDLPLASQPLLALWHLPDHWVWGLIVTLVLVALPVPGARFAGLNLVFLYLLAYTAQGVAVLDFFLRKFRIPVLWRSALLSVILTLPTAVAVVAFGVVDIWADFRKVRVPAAKI